MYKEGKIIMTNEQVKQDMQSSKNGTLVVGDDTPTEFNFEQFDDELLLLACFLLSDSIGK